jgi:hypothetical protein
MVRTRRHLPTPEQRNQVLTLAGLGITQDQIASLMRLAPKTLRLHYRHELDDGVIKATAAVAQSLYNMAVKDKVPSAAIFWLKARAGWKETQVTEQAGTQSITFQHLIAAKAFGEELHAAPVIEGSVVATEADEPEPIDLTTPALE